MHPWEMHSISFTDVSQFWEHLIQSIDTHPNSWFHSNLIPVPDFPLHVLYIFFFWLFFKQMFVFLIFSQYISESEQSCSCCCHVPHPSDNSADECLTLHTWMWCVKEGTGRIPLKHIPFQNQQTFHSCIKKREIFQIKHGRKR